MKRDRTSSKYTCKLLYANGTTTQIRVGKLMGSLIAPCSLATCKNPGHLLYVLPKRRQRCKVVRVCLPFCPNPHPPSSSLEPLLLDGCLSCEPINGRPAYNRRILRLGEFEEEWSPRGAHQSAGWARNPS